MCKRIIIVQLTRFLKDFNCGKIDCSILASNPNSHSNYFFTMTNEESTISHLNLVFGWVGSKHLKEGEILDSLLLICHQKNQNIPRNICFKRILIHSRSPKYIGNVFFQKWLNLGPIWKVSFKFFHRSRGVYLLIFYFFSLSIVVTYHFSYRKVLDFQCGKILGNKRVGWISANMKP